MPQNLVQPIFIGVIVLFFVLFMFRSSRKRQRDAATLTSTLKPGAEIMTSGGIYGTIESIDEDENKIVLKTGPTSHITIHRQAVGRVVTPVPDTEDPAESVAPAAPTLNGEPIDDPAYGERIDPEAATGARGSKPDAK